MRAPIIVGIAAIALLVAGAGSWTATARLASAITATGTVSVPDDHHAIQHPEGGTLAERHVARGDHVGAGDPILRLDDTLLSERKALIVAREHELRARIARLEAERDDRATLVPDTALADAKQDSAADKLAEQQRFHDMRRAVRDQERRALEARRTQLEHELDGVQAEHTALTEQRRFITTELATQRALREKGLTNETRLLSLEREKARIQGSIGRLEADRERIAARIGELESESRLMSERSIEAAYETLDTLRPQLADLVGQRAELHRRIERKTLRAPVDGIVHEISAASESRVFKPSETMASIVPLDRPLIVRARIAPDDIDQLHVDQHAALHFAAFGRRDVQLVDGAVTTISPDALTDSATGARHYIVEIAIPAQELDKLDGRELKPGMHAEARIRTEARTPLAYLFGPVSRYLTRALQHG